MASKTGGMLQDQNLNIRFNEASVGWKTNVSKAPSKSGAALAGRTPLGDLSNSLKPSMNRGTRKQSSTLFSPLIEKEAVTSGIALDATKKKKTSKASLKQQPAGRKVLFDIADEGFLHNHEECIKAQLGDMDLNQCLQMIGLDDGEQKSTLQTPSASFRKEAVKHKEAHDNTDSPLIFPEHSVRLRSNYDDWLETFAPHKSDSPPISPEHWSSGVDPDWRCGYSDHDDWGIVRDWIDTDSDCELKSP